MTTFIKNANIEIVSNFVDRLMDGETPPPEGPALAAIVDAMGVVVQANSSAEYELLGRKLMRLCVNRVRSNLAAEKTLNKFLRGGDHA